MSAIHIPDSPDPVPESILATLPPGEARLAREMRGYRTAQFVGGRIALRRACEQLGVRPHEILPDDRGAPQLPRGLVGSISHKRTLAIGMVASAGEGSLGVDIEEYEPARPRIEGSVLREAERAAIANLPEDRRWIATLIRFSIKESIYKALDPYVHRYVGFDEAEVTPDLEGGARVSLHLKNGEGPFEVDAAYQWLHGRLLTSVRIRSTEEQAGLA